MARTATCIALFAGCAAAQTVVPALLSGVEGGSGSSLPFGTNQAVRMQCVYAASELPWSGPRLITGISLRADNSIPGTTTFPSKGFVVVSVRMSTTYADPESLSADFERNWGSDLTTVVAQVPVVLPAQPAQPGVRAANIDFLFAQPWWYGLTPVRPGEPPPANLLVELVVHSQPSGSYRIDHVGNCSSTPIPFGSIGPACAPAGGSNLRLIPEPSLQAGSVFRWQVADAPPSSAVLLWLNVTNQGTLRGVPTLPLPVPLFDPGNPSQAFAPLQAMSSFFSWPAPDCWLLVDPAGMLLTVSDAAGNATIAVNIGPGRRYVGNSLFAQALAQAQTANPLLLVTSQGMQSSICGPLGVGRVFATGSATATTGQVSVNQGFVLEVR